MTFEITNKLSFLELSLHHVSHSHTSSSPLWAPLSHLPIISLISAAALVTGFPWALSNRKLGQSDSTWLLLFLCTSHFLPNTALSPPPWDFLQHQNRHVETKVQGGANIGPVTDRSQPPDGPEKRWLCLRGLYAHSIGSIGSSQHHLVPHINSPFSPLPSPYPTLLLALYSLIKSQCKSNHLWFCYELTRCLKPTATTTTNYSSINNKSA